MIARLWLALAVLCLVPAGLLAQETESEAATQAALLPSGLVPDELLGVACETWEADPAISLHRACMSEDPLARPSSTFSVADWSRRPSVEEMHEMMREPFHERIILVAREEPFAVPGMSEAEGQKGFYRTELGDRYVWMVYDAGKLTRVQVTLFAETDRKALVAEIENKIFGIGRDREAKLQ